jgi:chromosome partition protein MukB
VSRTRITALVLVNWKGVFYERYLFDRHVTALEGANGAGKTTVMIGAYVALLPDLSKLRFTNLGETAATGGDRGIYGRLGEPGRPSYTILELDVAGARVLAGVRLARLAEPTVEPTAFIIQGLTPGVPLSDLFLVRELDGDHVPELDDIRAAVQRTNAQIETFRAIKDYFAAMFDLGISPMRLAEEEARSKLNEMLRTSMTGGISRALTSELRGFLLREETGLSDTLSRMRANLDACARTRSEVTESRHLEREISAIYEAGMDMFAAAVQAASAAADEAEADVEKARPVLEAAVRAETELTDALAVLDARRTELETRAVTMRDELIAATAERDRTIAAEAVVTRLAALETELRELTEREAAARARQVAATSERAAARQARARAVEAVERAAHGLADLQAGLDELVRRAHAHRQLVRRLDDARRATQRPELASDDVGTVIAELDGERDRLETERARLARDGRDIESRREEHARALAALSTLELDTAVGSIETGDGSPHARGRALLARLAEREATLARAAEIGRERREAERLATRQTAARALAEKLGVTSTADTAATVVAELAELERALRERGQAAARRRDEASADRQRETELRGKLATVDERLARWQLANATVERLAARAPFAPKTRAELGAARDHLARDLHALGDRRTKLEASREELAERAAAVGRSGTNLDPEVLRLRDELGGELLASRFEDLDLAAASWVEAKLGPLTSALIVEDIDAAVTAVEQSERHATTVYLVRPDAVLSVDPPDDLGELADASDVATVEPYGVRVTRRLPRPSLGRRARERQVKELRDAIERDARALDEVEARAGELASWRRDLETLDSCIDAFAAGDPSEERTTLESQLAELAAQHTARDDAERESRALDARDRTRHDGLRRLLPDVALVDPPDHAARAAELAELERIASTTAADLARLASARATLAAHLDSLRHAPPDDAELAARATRATEIEARLDVIATARAALEDVLVHRHAEADAGAEAALGQRAALAPALEAQHADARAAVEAAGQAEATTETAWEAATTAAQAADAHRLAAVAHRDRAAAELAALGTDLHASDAAAERARMLAERITALTAAVAHLETERGEAATQRAVTAERLGHAALAVADARARLSAATREAGPTVAAWAALRDRASREGLLHAALISPATPRHSRQSLQLTADAWSKRELLLDRLARARDGAELVNQLREQPRDGEAYLACWQLTREWLRRRVPAQVAEVDEPLLALERLRDHLDVLEARLRRQEQDLRGASEDVARGIDVLVRRAHGQVRRLNQQLDGISFGSIQGIRVEIRRIERMDQILRALRLGEAQELLFIPSVPIEEALDEIFRRYGGGGRAGAQRLLDYREYVELVVEIKRRSTGEWEPANPTKVSTGEAIGIGAALMMVVLTEWERDANLLRARRTAGSLRFLFLDEANRLSRDNLAVLFDLCKTLDLQLLIAAPEVARAEGNTTYRLVRHVTEDGREEVIVSGRRAVAVEPETVEASEAVMAPEPVETPSEPAAAIEPAAPLGAVESVEISETAAPTDEPAPSA